MTSRSGPDAGAPIRHRVHARAGLMGNPSDGYGGKAIAVEIGEFAAEVVCRPGEGVELEPGAGDRRAWADLAELAEDVRATGYHGGLRLLKAAVRRFAARCEERGVALPDRGLTLSYRSDIPRRVGLAGSSAIVVAALRCLMDHFEVEIPREELPGLALAVEVEELGIAAGLMDRVVQVYGGLVYMDLRSELLEARGHGRYEGLDPAALPPLFLAWRPSLAEGSERVHGGLRRRWLDGDAEVTEAVERLAALADRARGLLRAGRGAELPPLMDENFDIRASLVPIDPGNRELVETGRRLGAAVKFAGSGGAVVGAWDGDPARLARLREAYEAIGAGFRVPRVG